MILLGKTAGRGGEQKQAKVKFIKRHFINFWLPSQKRWCDCYSVGTSVCHPVISTSVVVAGARIEMISVFLRRLGVTSLFPEVNLQEEFFYFSSLP